MTGVTVKLMACGVFSGELNYDPESAAADLGCARCEVMPDKRRLLPSSLSCLNSFVVAELILPS
jgi:hypothetical protein